MPHDVNGKLLQIGDEVILRGKISSIGQVDGDKYCNCCVELKERMPAYPDQVTTVSAINAAQVEKVEVPT